MGYYDTACERIERLKLPGLFVKICPSMRVTIEQFESEEFRIQIVGRLGLLDFPQHVVWLSVDGFPQALEFFFTGRGIHPEEFDHQIEQMMTKGWLVPIFMNLQEYTESGRLTGHLEHKVRLSNALLGAGVR